MEVGSGNTGKRKGGKGGKERRKEKRKIYGRGESICNRFTLRIHNNVLVANNKQTKP